MLSATGCFRGEGIIKYSAGESQAVPQKNRNRDITRNTPNAVDRLKVRIVRIIIPRTACAAGKGEQKWKRKKTADAEENPGTGSEYYLGRMHNILSGR